MSSRNAFDISQLALLGEAVECFDDVAVFVWDEDRTYVAVNQAACHLVGKTRREILPMKVGDLAPDRASPLFECSIPVCTRAPSRRRRARSST